MALKNFLEELRWRGLLQDSMPGTEEMLLQGPTRGYIGFDPTADSLHVGNMVQIAMLMHFQRAGHLPIALVGGATGMVGDPSGKKSERQLLVEEELRHNESCIKKQLERFIDFGKGANPGSSAGAGSAELVNNYDWFKDMSFLDFIRNVGKHISVNYMMAKDSVKSRLETGLSFTEFSYQLVQGYDFYWLWKHKGCKLQMGGSDQWGNITTGTELIRRMEGGEAFALTTPLLTKSDGSKFGKSDPGSGTGMTGNVWLDAKRTSPYKFYQFWLNASDEDVVRHAHVFTSWSKEEVDALVMDHSSAPHQRRLQKEVAGFITAMTHGKNELDAAINASEILFGSGATETLGTLSEQQWLDVFDGVPQCEMSKSKIEAGTSIVDLLSDHTGFLTSKGEAKRALKEASISINKAKAAEDRIVNASDLISGKFILLQRGKKNYFLVKAV